VKQITVENTIFTAYQLAKMAEINGNNDTIHENP